MQRSRQLLVMGLAVLVTSQLGEAALTDTIANSARGAWGDTYGNTSPNTANFNSHLTNIYNNNAARTFGQPSYLKGTGTYSDTSYTTFQDGHLGSSAAGFDAVNGTKSHDSGLHGSALAGVIVGAIIGGILLILGTIASIYAWRLHKMKKNGTLYADYRSNTLVGRRDPYLDRQAPQEYYRESHRQTLNHNYGIETGASALYVAENHPVYGRRSYITKSGSKYIYINQSSSSISPS